MSLYLIKETFDIVLYLLNTNISRRNISCNIRNEREERKSKREYI